MVKNLALNLSDFIFKMYWLFLYVFLSFSSLNVLLIIFSTPLITDKRIPSMACQSALSWEFLCVWVLELSNFFTRQTRLLHRRSVLYCSTLLNITFRWYEFWIFFCFREYALCAPLSKLLLLDVFVSYSVVIQVIFWWSYVFCWCRNKMEIEHSQLSII